MKRKVRRAELIPFFEAAGLLHCGSGGVRGRPSLGSPAAGLGHEVKLVPPEAIRPFVKKGKKNDAADAAALRAAASRPDIKFVPVKSHGTAGIPGPARGTVAADQAADDGDKCGSGANLMGPSAMLAPGTREVGDGQAGVPGRTVRRPAFRP